MWMTKLNRTKTTYGTGTVATTSTRGFPQDSIHRPLQDNRTVRAMFDIHHPSVTIVHLVAKHTVQYSPRLRVRVRVRYRVPDLSSWSDQPLVGRPGSKGPLLYVTIRPGVHMYRYARFETVKPCCVRACRTCNTRISVIQYVVLVRVLGIFDFRIGAHRLLAYCTRTSPVRVRVQYSR